MTAIETALMAALKGNPALARAILAAKPGSKFAKKAKKGQFKAANVSSDDRKAMFRAATLAAFTKAGYAVTAADLYVNIKTFKGFAEGEGLTINDGQKSVRVKIAGQNGDGMPLFHRSQFTAKPVDPAVAIALDAEYDAEYGAGA